MNSNSNYNQIIEPYINGTATTCSYCDYLAPLVLLTGQHTYITLVIGQYVEGYVQLCAKQHRTSAAGLKEDELEEFELMKKVIRKAFQKVYNVSGIAFEHGKAGTCLLKSTDENKFSLCHHCHIHYVPVEVDIRDKIKEYLPKELNVKNIDELKIIRQEILNGSPYLYFEDVNQIGYVYPVNNQPIPRQFLRTSVAEKLGIPEKGDWITYPGTEYFQASKDKLQPVLNEFYQQEITKA